MVIAAIVVLLIYVPLNVFYMIYTSPGHSQPTDGAIIQNTKVAVQITDVNTDVNGNVNVMLSLNVKDLLKFLQGDSTNKGEATGNPIPHKVKLLINNPKICADSPAMKYIVYVHTSPDHHVKRELLRATWASTTLFSERIVERVFLMGHSEKADVQKKVEVESEKYGDIVQGDFMDNYKNLTLKGLMGLRWVTKYCRQAAFAIKADDDAFVNIFSLLNFLKQHEDKKRLLACPLWSANTMPILRDPNKCAKWCVRFDEFPGQRHFPKYCAGLAFVLAQQMIPLMYNASLSTPFFWIDDVYMTGLLPAKVKDVDYVSLIKNFTLKQDEAIAELKDLSKPFTHMMVHAKKSEEFMNMWNMLLKRLPYDDVKLISSDIVEQNVDLKKILTSHVKKNRSDKSQR